MRLRPGVLFFNRLIGAHWELWVVENYSDPATAQRTPTGNLMYQAKYRGDFVASQQLGKRLAQTVRALTATRSSFSDIQAVCAVPYFGVKSPFSVPHLLASSIAEALNVPDHSKLVCKVRDTASVKGAPSAVFDPAQFEANWEALERRVLLVDDVYRTGGTLASLAKALQRSNVIPVAGVAAVRAT